MADLRRFTELAHERPAGEVLYQFLRDSGLLSQAGLDGLGRGRGGAPEHRPLLRHRPGPVRPAARRSGRLRGPASPDADRRRRRSRRPPRSTPDADAVAVLTVHKAKGLEFPVVFMTGPGRRPLPGPDAPRAAGPAGGAGAGDAAGGRRSRPGGAAALLRRHDPRPRRAGPDPCRRLRRAAGAARVAVRARGPGPAGRRPRPARSVEGAAHAPLERLAAFEPKAEAVGARPRGRVEGPLSLSFYQVDDYLTCPLKYKYVHVLRVPIAPHHSIVYGAALHQAVQEFHRRQARGYLMTEDELLAAFDRAWSNEGFLTREHEEARLAAGRAALRRFREGAAAARDGRAGLRGARVQLHSGRRSDPRPDGPRGHRAAAGRRRCARRSRARSSTPTRSAPALPGLHPERVTITDYKSSDVRDPVRARERARESLQLQIYAMAYQAETGTAARTPCSCGSSSRAWSGGSRWTRSGSTRPATRSGARPPAFEPGSSRPRRTTSPAATAPFATSARRARPSDRRPARRSRSTSATRWCRSRPRPMADVVRLTADDELASLVGCAAEEFVRVWGEERLRQFAEDVPQGREADMDVRVGPGPGPAARLLRPGSPASAGTTSRRRLLASRARSRRILDTYADGLRRDDAGPARDRADARAAGPPVPRSASSRTGRWRWPSIASSRPPGWSRHLAAVVVSQRVGCVKPAAGDLRGRGARARRRLRAGDPARRRRPRRRRGRRPAVPAGGPRWVRMKPEDSPLPDRAAGSGRDART